MFEDVKVIVGGCLQLSLVPTPFLFPLFDWLQHTQNEGGRPGRFVTCIVM